MNLVKPKYPKRPKPYKEKQVTIFDFDFSHFGNAIMYLFIASFPIYYACTESKIDNPVEFLVIFGGIVSGIVGVYYFFVSFKIHSRTKRIKKDETELLEDQRIFDFEVVSYQARLAEFWIQTKGEPLLISETTINEVNFVHKKECLSDYQLTPEVVNSSELNHQLNNYGSETEKVYEKRKKRLTNSYYFETDLSTLITIKSEPDYRWRIAKRIGYLPNDTFSQEEPWKYSVVKMPKKNSLIKFPRKGRSDRKGVKEEDFFVYLNKYFKKDFNVFNDRHIPTKNGRPYQPDFVLSTENDDKNIFFDIEIDEPYNVWNGTATNLVGENNFRDEFFTERGWIVIRFAEIQIVNEPDRCCSLIAAVIKSIDPTFEHHLLGTPFPSIVVQWNKLQSEKWASENYRELYIGIDNFVPHLNVLIEYEITESEIDNEVEIGINKFQNFVPLDEGLLASSNTSSRDERIQFDSTEHRYYVDGNPDTISVTQLIDKFFPEFDAPYWSRKKAIDRVVLEVEDSNEENIIAMQNIILKEWEDKRINTAELGKALHTAIENYYNGSGSECETKEFQHFLSFKRQYPNMIPYRSEWRIFDEDLLVAGTVDMVYEKPDGSLYMFDWKRSERVVYNDGSIRADSFQYAFGELGHLGNNSFNKYCLQMNIYRAILEKRYDKKISSMNLLVLHEIYKTYHYLEIPNMDDEVNYIFYTLLTK